MQSKEETNPSEEFAQDLVRELLKDEAGPKLGPEARRVLEAGFSITYRDDAYPGEIVKLYPDSRREIIDFDENHQEVVVRKIPDKRIR